MRCTVRCTVRRTVRCTVRRTVRCTVRCTVHEKLFVIFRRNQKKWRKKYAELVELHCAKNGVYCTHGNHYAPQMMDELAPTGVTRISFLHYSTVADVERVLEVIGEFFADRG